MSFITPEQEGYVFVSEIADTGESTVSEYLSPDGDRVAIKDVIPYTTICNELNALSLMVGTDNIVEVIDILMYRDATRMNASIVMKMYSGDLLSVIPYKRRMKVLRSVTYQVSMGLYSMHLCGLLHGDVKPGNILVDMVDDKPVCKIADMGLTVRFNNVFVDTVVYSDRYRPPECYVDARYWRPYDDTADMWALGCTLYEFVENRPIFEIDVLHGGVRYGYRIRRGVATDVEITRDKSFNSLLKGMLQLDPDDRLHSDEVYNHRYVAKYRKYRPIEQRDLSHPVDISPNLSVSYVDRNKAVVWISEMVLDSDMPPSYIFIAADLLDRFLSSHYVIPEDLELVALVCLMSLLPEGDLYRSCCDYPTKRVIDMWMTVMSELKYRLYSLSLDDLVEYLDDLSPRYVYMEQIVAYLKEDIDVDIHMMTSTDLVDSLDEWFSVHVIE